MRTGKLNFLSEDVHLSALLDWDWRADINTRDMSTLMTLEANGSEGDSPQVLHECDKTLNWPLDMFTNSLDEGAAVSGRETANVVCL